MIQVVQEKYPEATMQARRDFANVEKRRIVENPYWFRGENEEYYGLYGCIAWPQRVVERDDQRPGYGAVVAVVKDDRSPEDAIFRVVSEAENMSAQGLLNDCMAMRGEWGFGVHPQLLRVFLGDYRQFENIVANYNSRIYDDRKAFVVSPPDDFDNPRAFDLYLGMLRSVLAEKSKRLYLGRSEIIRNRILSFLRDDPAILALGGLIHTMLIQLPWMEQATPSIFQLPDN